MKINFLRFFSRNYIKKGSGAALVLVFIWLFTVQLGFLFIQKSHIKTIKSSITSLSNALIGPSNFQTLASISNELEANDTFRCPIIKILKNGNLETILDLSYRGECERQPLLLKGERADVEVFSANGDKYKVEFSSINSFEYNLMLWMLRIFGLVFIFFLTYIRQYRHDQELKISQSKFEYAVKIDEASRQVSHDIRSPLAALNMIVSNLDSMPEDKRILIRSSVNRINDIANNLLSKSKSQNHNFSQDAEEIISVAALIDSLVSEKRMQYRERVDIKIEAHLQNSYGLFIKVNSVNFKSILSNIINNSVEALIDTSGNIDLSIESCTENISIIINDNGKGIPKFIIEKLGNKGVSHGKENSQSGSGIGVYHAKKYIESIFGSFDIKSKEGKGTSVVIKLKKNKPPHWFVEKLQLTRGQNLVAVDDDDSILKLWGDRLANIIKKYEIKFITFSSGNKFRLWVKENINSLPHTQFLIDFDFLGQNLNGLDLIEELNIKDKSILVTSRYEESRIIENCERLNLGLIPKQMASFIPIEIEEWVEKNDVVLIDDDNKNHINRQKITQNPIQRVSNVKFKYDLCLLDDDRELIQAMWGAVAKNNRLNVKMFTTPSEFFSVAEGIDRQTPIYVDVSLGNGIKGTDVAIEIHKLGFKEINLATGYDAGSIQVPPFIQRVCGKDFPIANLGSIRPGNRA
jgi:signal transduction histidine kinase